MALFLYSYIQQHAREIPEAIALRQKNDNLSYAELDQLLQQTAWLYLQLGIQPKQRIAVYMEKRFEAVISMFAANLIGAVFVPINPQLKPHQVQHILTDCDVSILITTPERHNLLEQTLARCNTLQHCILAGKNDPVTTSGNYRIQHWTSILNTKPAPLPRDFLDQDMAAILYTSGSTGKPKGVILSHRNLLAGAESVSQYLENGRDDSLLSVLPLSFDYGLSQLTTALFCGAQVVLLNYLFPRDIVKAVGRYRITGLAAVPPLWIQLAELDWPDEINQHLRYITNSGGSMPLSVLQTLRSKLPQATPYLMYGLTEAFRSTYLPPNNWSSARIQLAKPSPMPKSMSCAPMVPSARPTKWASWHTAAHW